MRDTNTDKKETRAFNEILKGLSSGKCFSFTGATCYFHYKGNSYLSVREDRLIIRNSTDGAIYMPFTKESVIHALMKYIGATPANFLAHCKHRR